VRARAGLWVVVAVAVGGLVWALTKFKSQPPEVQFARVTRATIISGVPTNGRVEPIEWAAARAERAGAVQKIMIERGRSVRKDEPLAELDSSEARAALAAAQDRIAEARAALDVIARGGRATDLAEIASGLSSAKLEFETAQKEVAALERLAAKQAATPAEVTVAKQRVERAQLQIQALEQKKAALGVVADRGAAQARLDGAQAAAGLAEAQVKQSVVRAPIEGVVYQFDLKPGAYLNAGDAVASIGKLDRVRVNVFVDEPDLGRVAKGMPVVITWVAKPGRVWDGEVDRTPTQIVAMGTRQVGEVVCVIKNPDRDLLPGTNVDAEIRSETVADALTVAKEAIRTERTETGVFVLAGDRLVWKKVKVGVSNTTRSQVEGLSEGDPVALYSDKALKDGMLVKAVFP
jgi:multidrug efflux pump subunit AcrA (membrane-fusion protein)